MSNTSTQGIFIQQCFPLGAFGPRQWSLSEMRRFFRWLKGLGYTDVVFAPVAFFRSESDDHTILELGARYHSGLSEPPAFEPGFAYDPTDKYLGTREGLQRAAFFRDQAAIARDVGLTPWLVIFLTLGSPEFLENNPELAAVNGSETFWEGCGFCPSRPRALAHLLEFYQRQIEYFDAMQGFMFFPRDPGGCGCRRCTPQGTMITRVCSEYYKMIRHLRPEAPVGFLSWHIKKDEVAELASGLPGDVLVWEAPRIHALDAPINEYVDRVREWQKYNRRVEAWLETQENPTALLPSVYPRRIRSALTQIKDLGITGLWQTSTQNPYLFPLHFWLTPKLWEKPDDYDRLLSEYLAQSYGPQQVKTALNYIDRMERAWEAVQNEEHYKAGFLGLFVVTFPFRMLPESLIRCGVPASICEDLNQAVERATEALDAAERWADEIREFHALEANIIVVSAEVFYYRVRMRQAKIPVLQALCAGDADTAGKAWGAVEQACEQMVVAARSAPNTDVLARHWRRLELLPRRLKTLAQHLPELAETKSFRPIKQTLYIGDLYHSPTAPVTRG
jgi:hypothetical protein